MVAGSIPRQSVLVVDDHPGVAGTTAEILRRAGLDVVTASRGDEAVDLTKKRTFDVVVLDYEIAFDRPTEDLVVGWSETSEIILVSAVDPYALSVFAERYRNEIFAALHKPVPPDLLLRTVGDALVAARDRWMD